MTRLTHDEILALDLLPFRLRLEQLDAGRRDTIGRRARRQPDRSDRGPLMRRRETDPIEDQDREDAARREDQVRSDAEYLDIPSPGAPVERAGLARDEVAMKERGRHRAGEDAWEDFVRHATIVEIEWAMRVSPEPELSPDEPERDEP